MAGKDQFNSAKPALACVLQHLCERLLKCLGKRRGCVPPAELWSCLDIVETALRRGRLNHSFGEKKAYSEVFKNLKLFYSLKVFCLNFLWLELYSKPSVVAATENVDNTKN